MITGNKYDGPGDSVNVRLDRIEKRIQNLQRGGGIGCG